MALEVDPVEFSHKESIMDHMPKIAIDFVFDVLIGLYGKEALGPFRNSDGRRIKIVNQFETNIFDRIKPHQSEIHTSPTMPYNDCSLDDIALVWNALLKYGAVEPEELIKSTVLDISDELSVKIIVALQTKRIWEAKVDQLCYVTVKPRFFHTWMTLLDIVYHGHWGKNGTRSNCILS